MMLANRIVIMNDGCIMQEGTPLDVYENPRNIFVAGFIGSPSMNFLETKVVEKNGQLYMDGGSFRLAIPEGLQYRYRPRVNDKVVFGIRPEHISDRSFAADFPGRDELKALVDVIEPMGSEVILIVTVGKHQLTAKVDPHAKASLHQPIELSFDMNNMHLFDKEIGEVI